MTDGVVSRKVTELIHLFDVMQTLQRKLFLLAEEKLDAMRNADVQRLQKLLTREAVSVTRLKARHQQRQGILAAISAALGLPSGALRTLTASQLADHLAPADRPRFVAAAERLREASARLARANRLVAVASRELLNHLAWVFSSVRPEEDRPSGYGQAGARRTCPATRILETVG